MPLLINLASMRTRVRQITDQEQSTFVEDLEIDGWINEGIRQFWQMMVTADPDRGMVSVAFPTVAGTEFYALPLDFMAIRALDYPLGGGNYLVDVEGYEFKERNQLQANWSPIYAAPCKYRVTGGSVEGSQQMLSLRPDPGTATLTLHYVAVPRALVNDTDEFDGVIGLEDYPVFWAALQVRGKAEEDDSKEARNLSLLEQKINTESNRRNRSGQRRVARTRNRRYSRFPFPYPS